MDHNSVKLKALHGVFESDHGFLLDGLTAMTSFGYSQMSGSVTSSGSPTEDCWDGNDGAHNFPAGLRVMVVDDDSLCLMIMKRMLQQCNYKVTTCSRAREALSLLRENRNKYDLVISDVYMPDMDGFKLLELIGLEMDLPVIMVSANGETSTVMKGITHGACDYLLKPVRIEELRNIWQHVVRKRVHKDVMKDEHSGEWDEAERTIETPKDGLEYTSRKRKEKLELIDDLVDDISGLKKARVVWSGELHRQFVKAVNHLGIEKAVPKRILEIMNVQGLSRENVASHLQKYRLGLKRLSGVNPEPLPVASFQAAKNGEFGGTMRVQPGGTKSSISSTRSMTSGVFGRNINQLDSGTLTTLAQLQALQQKPTEPTVSLEEWKPKKEDLHQVCLQRTQSLEMGKLSQVPRTKLWQHMNNENNRETYGDKKLGGELPNAAIIRFQQHMEPSGPRQGTGTKEFGRIFGPHGVRMEESAPGQDDDEPFDLSKIVEEMGTAISLPSDQTLSYITIPGQQIGNFNDYFDGNELPQLTGSDLQHKGQGNWY